MIKRPEKFFLALGIVMTALLLWVAVESVVWDILLREKFSSSGWHYLAHFVIFAVLAVLWVLGLPRINVIYVVLAIVLFGFAQEAIEMAGHAHAFELDDACVDAAGAILGITWTSHFLVERQSRQSDNLT